MPDNNYAIFYSDGWCNDKKVIQYIECKTFQSRIMANVLFILLAKAMTRLLLAIDMKKEKSIKITNQNGDGLCVYPDYYINPVKNDKTRHNLGKKVNTNLFEFIENTFFKYDKNKSKLKNI